MSAAAFRCALITLEIKKKGKKTFGIKARGVKHLTRARTETLSDKQSDERADREGSQERQAPGGESVSDGGVPRLCETLQFPRLRGQNDR